MKEKKSLPVDLLQSLDGVAGFDPATFASVHASGEPVTSIRINPLKFKQEDLNQFDISSKIPWTKYGYYLTQRPIFTLDPLLHAGAYYVQEASSMFLEQAIQQAIDTTQSIIALDLCAAPGGKSTHIQALLPNGSVLISNEVVRNRSAILAENITKWGTDNVIVTNNDPADFKSFKGLFDLIVVDAPCSGSGLFRKDPDAIDEWSLDQVAVCAIRQQKILDEIWPALKPGGVLIYSTCSYSKAEDEFIADWLTETKEASSIELNIDPSWNIVISKSDQHRNTGYRFYPDKLKGEGFYLACFKKEDGDEFSFNEKSWKLKVDKKLEAIGRQWINESADLVFYQHKEQLFAMTDKTLKVLLQLQSIVNIRKAGFKVGDGVRDEIIPDHALALSNHLADTIKQVELDKESAIAYLRKKDFSFNSQANGWILIRYHGYALGWIKNMGNRMNNYYPKEWRIRM